MFATYANLVANYFMAEGIVCEQSVLAVGLDTDIKQITQVAFNIIPLVRKEGRKCFIYHI